MLTSILLYSAFALNFLSACPIHRRELSQNDIIGLQLAAYLENLELSVYSGGCQAFSSDQWTTVGFPSSFQQDICTIASQQQNQTEYIASLLQSNGINAPAPCSYNFSYDSPTSFVTLANQVTSIGLGAYLGSLNDLSPALQTVAASILSVEARHDALVRNGMGASPFPTNFDVPLSSTWAYNLAQKFVTSCPQQLPIDLLPQLNFNGIAGTNLNFAWNPSNNNFTINVEPDRPLYIAIVNQNTSNTIYQRVETTSQGEGTVPLPEGLSGVVYACLTGSSGDLTFRELTTRGTLAGPVQLVLS